MTDKLNVLQNS